MKQISMMLVLTGPKSLMRFDMSTNVLQKKTREKGLTRFDMSTNVLQLPLLFQTHLPYIQGPSGA